MHNLEAVSAQRLYRLIAERIAEKIRSGEFLVGTRLPAERDLADILQVSRSSVREALIALELSGYVATKPAS
jgi:DNA-binding FadR family transcriptional regulator